MPHKLTHLVNIHYDVPCQGIVNGLPCVRMSMFICFDCNKCFCSTCADRHGVVDKRFPDPVYPYRSPIPNS